MTNLLQVILSLLVYAALVAVLAWRLYWSDALSRHRHLSELDRRTEGRRWA